MMYGPAKAAAILWGNAMADAIEDSRKENSARKRRVTANHSTASEKIVVMPLESAS